MSETLNEVSPMIEMDAHEFGLHLKQGGWRLGLLVARDVEPGEGESSGVVRSDRAGLAEGQKISAVRFAEMAGTHHSRVMRYYRAWERYAAKGRVPHASELSPGDEPDLNWELLPQWVLSVPESGGATGVLKLRIKLGHFADRQLKAHKRLLTFVEKELPEQPLDNETREYAIRLAELLEAEAVVLRRIHDGAKGEKLELDIRESFDAASEAL